MHQTHPVTEKISVVLSILLCGAFLCYGKPLRTTPAGSSHPSLVLMCLSAHPDDEDGAALAFNGIVRGLKTYSVLFTRGEGGQNEIGSELYEDLGELRTNETLEAAKILGTEAYFLGFPDFGFSKTAKETFIKWGGKDSVLARLVYFIRALKPDVIITNHDTVTVKPNRQHGNHQAVGITAYEAFSKAADPLYHPEQLNDRVRTWQVKKLFFRTFRMDSTAKNRQFVELDTRQRDSTGTPIEQIAIAALHKHRSQGLERITLEGIPDFFRRHRYYLVESDRQYPFDNHDLFSGITPSIRTQGSVTSAALQAAAPVKIVVSPGFVPLNLSGESGSRDISRTFVVNLIKNTSGKVDARLSIHAGKEGRSLFSKRISLDSQQYADTVRLTLGRDEIMAAKVLHFNVEEANIAHAIPASTIVTFQPVTANFESDALVGIVATYDNSLEEVLHSFHVNYRPIDSSALATEDLGKYTTILLDLRTFEFRNDAVKYANRLIDYSYGGGNLVCFYHKLNDWNGKGFSPYPITITNERVTEEDAAVVPLVPDHPLLTTPNMILPQDWNGWVQERSIYLPSDDTLKTSARYVRILAMSDENEHQPPTSLLWTRYGKGTYTYASLVLYRQLRILNDGAVKLLFNLISQKSR